MWIDGPIKRAVSLGKLVKSGGAGSVYLIREMPAQVAKIYHRDLSLTIYERKIKAMLLLTPSLPNIDEAGQRYVQIAWPEAILHDDRGQFIGFTMPMLDIKATSELEYILQERQARAEGLPVGLGAKITLAANLSGVIAELHRQHHYVVDMKPVNLRFYRQSLYMAMLDCDGFSIQGQGERFEAPQFTPDYLAPEFQVTGIDIAGEEQQDRFALAVVIFQLLNFGIHPFTGRPVSDQVPTDIPGRIKTRSYAYGLRPNKTITPSMVSGHDVISKHLRQLFDRAFESSGMTRPSANEWAVALRQYAQKSTGKLLVCENNKEHQYFSSLACAACVRENLLKRARQALASPLKPSVRKQARSQKRRGNNRAKPYSLPKRQVTVPVKAKPWVISKSKPYPFQKYVPLYTAPPQTFFQKYILGFMFKFPQASVIMFVFFLAFLWTFLQPVQNDELIQNNETYQSSPDVTAFQKTQEEMAADVAAKNLNYDVANPPVPAPDLDEASRLIELAAIAMTNGNSSDSEAALNLLNRSADTLNSSNAETIARHRRAFSRYLSSTKNLPGNIEDRQKVLKQEFIDILSRDPASAQTAEELGWLYLMTEDSYHAQQLFKQAIWAKPKLATAWYGLGISVLVDEDDETIIGIFTVAEQLIEETKTTEKVRSRIEYIFYQLPPSEQKRFTILQARARQLIEEAA